MKIRIALLATIGLVVLAMRPPAPPRLTIATPSTRTAVLDTIYGVTATAYDVAGRRSPSSTVTWQTRPSGAISIKPDSASKGQKATIAGVNAGTSWAIATWKRSDGTSPRDSVSITVDRAHVAKVVVVGPDSMPVGSWACFLGVAYDKAGGILTGRHVDFGSSNPAVAAVGQTPPPWVRLACPDTSVDPAKFRLQAPIPARAG